MGDVALLAGAAALTALATGLGAVPVFLLGARAEALRPFLWGLAIGLMGAASFVGLTQPVGALVAYALVEQSKALLPVSFGFAAGAMLALIAAELVPAAYRRSTWRPAATGTAFGAGAMLALSAALGV
ncbi:MAG: zinc transporter, family [Solirubrobacteraceae bacterium]|nr:zinc transporter, family [Solirubrobacteraceae bacterium]